VADRALAQTEKKAQDEGRNIVFVDEAGFYLLPSRVRTYAPQGHTPVLRAPLTRDHLAAISGITLEGRLLFQVQEHAYKGPDIVRFLRHLLRQIPGKLVVVWDGAPIHWCQAVKDCLAAGAARRLHLERLPGYAPERNPDAGVWGHLKHVQLRNLVCRDLAELRQHLQRAVARLRQKARALFGFLREPGYI
jgi:transposase